jgi:hypothetical protein
MTEEAPHYVLRQARPPSVVSADEKVADETGEKQLAGELLAESLSMTNL